MSVDGFIAMPSFRPDGRLESLNHGGGSKLPKTIPGESKRLQGQNDLVRIISLAAFQKKDGNKTKELDLKAGYLGGPYGMQPSASKTQKVQKTQTVSGKNSRMGSGQGASAGYTQGNPPAEAVGGGISRETQKNRRALLAGGRRSFAQPYGSETILGG